MAAPAMRLVHAQEPHFLPKLQHEIFRLHFLLGADCGLCCARLSIPRGTFFHHVCRIQQKLGRVFRELRPYPLYPLSDYFGNHIQAA